MKYLQLKVCVRNKEKNKQLQIQLKNKMKEMKDKPFKQVKKAILVALVLKIFKMIWLNFYKASQIVVMIYPI